MKVQVRDTKIPGLKELIPHIFKDDRGLLIKTSHKDTFLANGLEADFTEEFYTVSKRGVLRGMHFQEPPRDHVKYVFCVAGTVMDVLVDLRVGSPTYEQHEIIEMSAEKANMIYIPQGLAHGYYVLSETSTVIYNVTDVYSPEHDGGIHWDSAGIDWPTKDPILSPRDEELLPLSEYKSPFRYEG